MLGAVFELENASSPVTEMFIKVDRVGLEFPVILRNRRWYKGIRFLMHKKYMSTLSEKTTVMFK